VAGRPPGAVGLPSAMAAMGTCLAAGTAPGMPGLGMPGPGMRPGMPAGVPPGIAGLAAWRGMGLPGQVPGWPRPPGIFPGLDGPCAAGGVGGGPEVMEVWEGFLASYRRYAVDLAAHAQRMAAGRPEADPTNPGLCAQALGGLRSDKVCMQYLTKNCRRGMRCVDRHPPDAQIEMHKRELKRKTCRFGDQCLAQRCLFYHPRENGRGDLGAAPPPPPSFPAGITGLGPSTGSSAPAQPSADQGASTVADAATGCLTHSDGLQLMPSSQAADIYLGTGGGSAGSTLQLPQPPLPLLPPQDADASAGVGGDAAGCIGSQLPPLPPMADASTGTSGITVGSDRLLPLQPPNLVDSGMVAGGNSSSEAGGPPLLPHASVAAGADSTGGDAITSPPSQKASDSGHADHVADAGSREFPPPQPQAVCEGDDAGGSSSCAAKASDLEAKASSTGAADASGAGTPNGTCADGGPGASAAAVGGGDAASASAAPMDTGAGSARGTGLGAVACSEALNGTAAAASAESDASSGKDSRGDAGAMGTVDGSAVDSARDSAPKAAEDEGTEGADSAALRVPAGPPAALAVPAGASSS